jgi:hypothetical protein
LGGLYIQHKVNRRQEKMRAVRNGNEGIDGRESLGRYFDMVDHQDNGHIGADALNLGCDGDAIQETQVVLDDHSIYGARHKKAQTIGSGGGGCQFVPVLGQ